MICVDLAVTIILLNKCMQITTCLVVRMTNRITGLPILCNKVKPLNKECFDEEIICPLLGGCQLFGGLK